MNHKIPTRRDRWDIRLAGYQNAIHTLNNSPVFAERETALEWLKSSAGQRMAYMMRQLSAQKVINERRGS